MATVDTIRNITIQATTQGVDQATASLNKLSDAQDNVAQSGQSTATVTDQVASKQLSAQGAYDKLRTSIDSQYKSQQQLAKGETILTNAFQQGIISAGTYAQMHELLIDKYSKATPLSEAFGNAISGVKTQMVALASGMGPVGVLLAGFGPIGLAAAAGFGAVVSAIEYMVGEADRMGELAQQMQNFANTTGLTAQEIQQLEFTGSKFGASSEQVANTLVRFSTALAQLRQGTGPLFTDLDKINPQLVQQLSATNNVAVAWNLLAQAYATADKAQQNLLSRAIGGQRGNAGATSQLLQASAGGGIGGLANPADALTQDQITKWAQLKTEIDETNKIAQNLMASIWTEEVLQRQLQAAEAAENMAQAMKDIANQQSGLSWLGVLFDNMARAQLASQSQEYPASSAAELARQKLSAGLNSGNNTTNWANGIYQPQTGNTSAGPSPQVISAQTAAMTAALGPAATYSEKLDAALQKLAADYDNNVFGLKGTTDALNNYNRAVSATGLANAVTVTAAYVGALGPLASVTDQVNLKQLQLSKLMADGVPITSAQAAAILNLTRANAEWTQVNAQTTAGVFDMGTASKAAGDELQSWIDRKLLDPTNATQLANAHDILAAKLRQTQQAALDANPVLKALSDQEFALATATMTTANAAAAQVAHQLFPADWQAHLNDAAPAMAAFNSQLKDAMSLSENFANAFGQAMIQGKTMSQAMLSAVQSLESALISMISKQLVQQAFGGLLGTGGGGLFSLLGIGGGASSTLAASNAAATGVSASDVAFAFSSGGMVGSGGKAVYVHSAYFDNAPHFAGGGMITDGGVPIIAHPGERILNRTETAAYNNSASQPINIVNNNNFTGADPSTEARLRAYVDQSSKQAVTTAVQAVVRARSNNQISLQGR